MSAISFIERVSTPQDIDGDTVENIAVNDAIYATKVAKLELLEELQNSYLDYNALNAAIDDRIRALKKDRVKLEA